MPTLPTYCARNGQKGVWYVDVDEFSEWVPVLHHTLLGPGGKPWPNQFLKADRYDQPCTPRSHPEKAGQARRLEQIGLVVMTRDFWENPPGTVGQSIRMRMQDDGYVGLFRCTDPRFVGGHLTFRLGEQLCHLLRPGDFK
jgi:hypothetical protein